MKTCDECHKATEKFVRRYKEKKFCRNCYQLYFRRSTCSRCGEIARLPIFEKNPICQKCEKTKPCIRCGRLEQPLGKLTKYGLVCKSCYYYFRPNRGCNTPHKPSNMGTCKRCHRYRKLNETLCNKCLYNADIPCPKCNLPMPAGRGNICEPCYWNRLFHQRLVLNSLMLESSHLQSEWLNFGLWLQRRRGSAHASRLVNRYILFFYEISSKWKTIPDYKALLDEFGVEKLRRNQNIIKWLASIGKIQVNEKLKLDTAEHRRIQTHLERVAAQPLHLLWLTEYHHYLMMKYQLKKITLHSIRLALCPASYFLIGSSSPPTQVDLEYYLRKHRGQYSAISGFITFINKRFQLEFILPLLPKQKTNKRDKLLEKKLINIHLQQENTKIDEKGWIRYGLEYFHLIPTAICTEITLKQVRINSDLSYNVMINKKSYWLPAIRST